MSKTLDSDAIILVCHDTGSANVISAYLLSCPISSIRPITIVSGPALSVFKKQGIVPNIVLNEDISTSEINVTLENLKVSAAIMGTSHTSMFERRFIQWAELQGIPSIAIVDWWSGYATRFSTPGSSDLKYLPRYVAVSDSFAFDTARHEGIPQSKLFISGNPYWDLLQNKNLTVDNKNARHKIKQLLSLKEDNLLICIILGAARYLDLGLGCDEVDLLRVINPLPQIDAQGRVIDWVALKHPIENWDNFNAFVKSANPSIITCQDLISLEAIAASDCVIGIISTLQFEAALLGKRVLCLAPNGRQEKMPFIQVFKHIGIEVELEESNCHTVLEKFVGGSNGADNTLRLTKSITNGQSSQLISAKLVEVLNSR